MPLGCQKNRDTFPSPDASMEMSLDSTVTSRAGHARDIRGSVRSGNAIGITELGQNATVRQSEGATAGVGVGHTLATKVVGARGGSAGIVDNVGLTAIAILVDGGDVGEDVTLCKDIGAGADLEAVAAGLVPLCWINSVSQNVPFHRYLGWLDPHLRSC